MSQGGKIAVASSISVFIVTSILFSIFGYLCGLYRQKKKILKQKSPSLANSIIYEDILPKENEPTLELKSNIAYATGLVK